MTINQSDLNNKNIKFKTIEERKTEAEKELGQASDTASEIYKSRENEPNENLLIRNFYYSVYHLIKAISILDTGVDYNSHSALISYFNREAKKEGFLSQFGIKFKYDNIGRDIDILFRLRDQYDYRERFVVEEDYLEAEEIWLRIFPELDNLVCSILNNERSPLTFGSQSVKR